MYYVLLGLPMPKPKAIEVIVENKRTEYCRPYRHDDKYRGRIELCFGRDKRLVKIRYSPEEFKKITGADLSRIETRLSSCKLCKTDLERLLLLLDQLRKEKNIKGKGVLHFHGDDAMFEKFDVLYRPFTGVFKLSSRDLNEAYTPEITGTLLEWINETFGTEMGELFLDVIQAGLLTGVASTRYVTDTDRKFLHEIAAHLLSRIFKFLLPGKFSGLLREAYSFGKTLGTGNIKAAFSGIFKTPTELRAKIEEVKRALGLVKPTVVTPPPPPPPPPAPPEVEITVSKPQEEVTEKLTIG